MSLRERINSDRKLQIGLGLVLVLVVALFMMKKGGGEEEGAVEEPVAGVVSEEGVPLPAEAAASTEASLSSVSSGLPAPPMPPDVAKAYRADDLVSVLVVRDSGIDDELVKRYTDLVKGGRGAVNGHRVALWVVPVKQIARYGALTLGLNVQRVPALIVLRPKSLGKGQVEGSVLYGYQTTSSISQALIDATYKGPEASYHPG